MENDYAPAHRRYGVLTHEVTNTHTEMTERERERERKREREKETCTDTVETLLRVPLRNNLYLRTCPR